MIGDILQPTHLLFILVVALLVLGPKRLPEVGKSLGKGIRDFRGALTGDDNDEPQISEQAHYAPPPPVSTVQAPAPAPPVQQPDMPAPSAQTAPAPPSAPAPQPAPADTTASAVGPADTTATAVHPAANGAAETHADDAPVHPTSVENPSTESTTGTGEPAAQPAEQHVS